MIAKILHNCKSEGLTKMNRNDEQQKDLPAIRCLRRIESGGGGGSPVEVYPLEADVTQSLHFRLDLLKILFKSFQ